MSGLMRKEAGDANDACAANTAIWSTDILCQSLKAFPENGVNVPGGIGNRRNDENMPGFNTADHYNEDTHLRNRKEVLK